MSAKGSNASLAGLEQHQRPPSTHESCNSVGGYSAGPQSYKTTKTGITKRTTAGRKAIKVIEWYFYPEFAPKKLFKNKSVRADLKQVIGKHYEVLS